MAANRTRASNLQIYSQPFGSWAKVATSIHWSIPLLSTSVGVLYPEPPLKFPHQLMINTSSSVGVGISKEALDRARPHLV